MKQILILVVALLCGVLGTAQARSFNAGREAEAFLSYVEKFGPCPNDRQCQLKLRTRVEIEFQSFVLALKTKTPLYSASGSAGGSIDPQDRMVAAKLLSQRLQARDTERNQALGILQILIEQDARLTPAQVQGVQDFLKKMQE
jgi:hypothetical protein